MLHHTLRSAVISYNDPNFENVTLLLPGNGTNGAQNNTFLDSSTNNFTITRNGNTTQGTFSPYGTLWSNFFDGDGDYLSIANNAALNMGTSSFTIEGYIYLTATPTAANPFGGVIVDKDGLSGVSWAQYAVSVDPNRKVVFQASAAPRTGSAPQSSITGSTTLALNTWYHFAVTRNGTSASLWVNGVLDGSTSSVPSNLTSRSASLLIGWSDRGSPDASYNFPGYISNLRIVVGSVVYSANFTPPAAPLTAIANTSLLACQSNRLIDASSNNFTITRNGDVSVQRFSPFEPAESYSSAALAGSGFFDGTGDFLTAASNAAFNPGAGAFTWECWFYPTATWAQDSSGGDGLFFVTSTNGVQIGRPATVTGNAWGLAANGTAWLLTTTTLPTLNQWNHMAVARSGTGTNQTAIFLNGSRVAQGTVTQTFTQGSIEVGRATANYESTGYISDMRFVNGSAVYSPASATYTVPTAPLTAVANTSLFLRFVNAGIIDNAMMNDLRTVGNAQISAAQSRWGGSSILFDGTGDWLILPHTVNQQFFSGNFTIEFWLYLSATGAARGLVAKGTSTTGWLVSTNASNQVVFTFGTSTITSTATVSGTTWTHIAVAREGTGTNQTKIYINGTNSGTGTVSTNFNQTDVMYVGADRTAGNALNGYIDDLRITNGLARYTANFTPPQLPFPTR